MKTQTPNCVREAACRFGLGPGNPLLLGQILWSTQGRWQEGVELLCAAAEAGEAEALHVLGLAFFRGQGVEKDDLAARELQRAAAIRGLPAAQFELSLLLAQGIGGPIDERGAARWEAKAAEAGHPRACLNRGARLANSERPHWPEVASWYARAAAGGNAEAADRLRKMMKMGPVSGFLALPRAEIAEATPMSWAKAEEPITGGGIETSSNEVASEFDASVEPVMIAVDQPRLDTAGAIPASKPDAEFMLTAAKADLQRDPGEDKIAGNRRHKANDPRFSAVLVVKDREPA